MNVVTIVDILESQSSEIKLKNTIRDYVQIFFEENLSRYSQLLIEIFVFKNFIKHRESYTLYAATSPIYTVTLEEYALLFNDEFNVEETYMTTFEDALREIEQECIHARYDSNNIVCRESLISSSKVFREKGYIEIRFNPRFGPVQMLEIMKRYSCNQKREQPKGSHLSLVTY